MAKSEVKFERCPEFVEAGAGGMVNARPSLKGDDKRASVVPIDISTPGEAEDSAYIMMM